MKFSFDTADTHMHSIFSDGTDTPKELVQKAIRRKLSVIALTDHDTISGIDEFVEEGRKCGIHAIAGVEFSIASFNGISDIDLLGYFENGIQEREYIENICRNVKSARTCRIHKMADVFNSLGFVISFSDVVALDKGDGLLGRRQVAEAVYSLNRDKLSSIQEVFDKYLSDGLSADVKIDYEVSLKMGIDIIHKCGGIAIVAHPGVSNGKTKDPEKGIKLMEAAFDLGADGAEGYYVYHKNRPYIGESANISISLCNKYTAYIRQKGKMVFSGSDFHGKNKEISLGEQRELMGPVNAESGLI